MMLEIKEIVEVHPMFLPWILFFKLEQTLNLEQNYIFQISQLLIVEADGACILNVYLFTLGRYSSITMDLRHF